jgi:hypothetical protein
MPHATSRRSPGSPLALARVELRGGGAAGHSDAAFSAYIDWMRCRYRPRGQSGFEVRGASSDRHHPVTTQVLSPETRAARSQIRSRGQARAKEPGASWGGCRYRCMQFAYCIGNAHLLFGVGPYSHSQPIVHIVRQRESHWNWSSHWNPLEMPFALRTTWL